MLRIAIIIAGFLASAGMKAQHENVVDLVPIEVDRIFVPQGFDSNDNLEVVIDGRLPNNCHQIAHASVTPLDSGGWYIRAFARRFEGLCLPLEVPFSKVIYLGFAGEGEYDVKASGAESRLPVRRAENDRADDFLYAPVSAVTVESDATRTQYKVHIDGELTNSCLHWRDVTIIPHDDGFDILPVLDFRDDGGSCEDDPRSFRKTLELPSGLGEGRYLLHVRSMNGEAVNRVFTVFPPALPPIH